MAPLNGKDSAKLARFLILQAKMARLFVKNYDYSMIIHRYQFLLK
jgi:hypothetical protein